MRRRRREGEVRDEVRIRRQDDALRHKLDVNLPNVLAAEVPARSRGDGDGHRGRDLPARENPPPFPRVLDHELLSENELNPGSKYLLPPIQGSISASRFSMTGALPAGLWGNQLAIGNDPKSPYAGVQLPIPLLQGFIPVDFMVQGRPGGFSVYPKIQTRADKGADPELYK